MGKVSLHAAGEPLAPEELVGWRKKRGWTQKRAAAQLGISLKTYQNWEQGHRVARHPTLVRKAIGKRKTI